MNFPIVKTGLSICLIVTSSFYLLNEYKFSQYSLTKKLLLNDIITINPTINPAAISNRFVFLPRIDITANSPNLTDDIFDIDYIFNSHKKAVILNRKVSICSRPRKFFSFSNEWHPVTQETKYSPYISKTIYQDIKIGNFTIAEDIFNKRPRMDSILLSKNNIYKDFPTKKKNKFIYTYIGHGWFYHMNKGNVSRTMMKMTKSFSIDGSQLLSILMKIIMSLLFHSFFYISTGGYNGGVQLSNQERINILISNCNENDVRMRYQYYNPKSKISIVAFKDRNLLMTKDINGFNFGNFVPRITKSPEEVIPKYPPEFSQDNFNYQKIFSATLFIILIYSYGSSNKYKRDASIVIVSSIVLIVRSAMWKRSYLLFGSIALFASSIIVYYTV